MNNKACTQNKIDNLEVLAHPGFLVALLLLVANDFYLKYHYPSWLTGKLSDFAGLYVFAQFIAAITGVRIAWIAIVSAILFAAWKSPLSTPLINLVNIFSPLKIHRMVDYTDLIALIVLPLAVGQYAARTNLRWGFLKYPSAILAMLAIMATSAATPFYNVRFDLQEHRNNETLIGYTYARVDELLKKRGMQCVACAQDSPYREYFDPQGYITTKINYDRVDRKLFVSIDTHTPDAAKERIDELQAVLMELLRPSYDNITVIRETDKRSNPAQYRSVGTLKIDAPPVGFPLSCDGNGINQPEIAKALAIVLAIVDESTHIPAAVKSRSRECNSTDRCSYEMCRYVAFGKVTGPNLHDRSIRVRTRGYVGWGGTTLYIELAQNGDDRDQAQEFMDNLQSRLTATLSKNIPITVIPPSTDPRPEEGRQ